MNVIPRIFLMLLAFGLVFAPVIALRAQEAAKPFKPYSGQPGRDVVWVPTPEATVQKMLDMAELKPDDYVIDLGSGDGRNVIAAAKRGIRGHGVEFNPNMVALATQLAKEAGVAHLVKFIEGDMYAADIAQASVLPLFLLTENLNVLMPSFLKLKPGARIVTNGFTIDGWEFDAHAIAEMIAGNGAMSIFMLFLPARPVHGGSAAKF